MKFKLVSSVVLLVFLGKFFLDLNPTMPNTQSFQTWKIKWTPFSLASTGLPLSQATKLIFDSGNVIAEGLGTFNSIYNYNDQKTSFHLMDEHKGWLRFGNVRFGGIGSPKDVTQMSFVLELTGSFDEIMSSRDEDQVWYQESTASLLEKVDEISGNVVIRDLHAAERVQMDKFKQSHDASHQLKVIYKNGATQLQSNVKTTNNLNLDVDLHFFNLRTTQGRPNDDRSLKEVNLKGIKGDLRLKSFVIEDAAKSNCEDSYSVFKSLGMQGYCLGNIWIEKL